MKSRAVVPQLQRPLRLGITCYPTFGGSGIVGTQVGMEMARRGHQVHFICPDLPRRVDLSADNVFFHKVETVDYPVFQHAPYAVALASSLVGVTQAYDLDLLHVHYAVPHAISAFLAREMMGDVGLKVATTLHGTDITLVGSDPSYLPVTRFSIQKSDAVTTPSAFLRDETRRRLDLPDQRIDVLPNFVDTQHFAPFTRDVTTRPCRSSLLDPYFSGGCRGDAFLTVVHVSNFRPLKRVGDVLAAFAQVSQSRTCRLLMIGDGPERLRAEAQAKTLGIGDQVAFLGAQLEIAPLLAASDVFVLPSATESFGLAALEAMSAGLPVVASDVGGLPEVVAQGETGVLTPVGDVAAIAGALAVVLDDDNRRRAMGLAARQRALRCFALEPAVDRYEALYRGLVAGNDQGSRGSAESYRG